MSSGPPPETPSIVGRRTPSSRPVARSCRATCASLPAAAMKASVPTATAAARPCLGPRIMAAARLDPGAKRRTAPSLVAAISIPALVPPSCPPRNWRLTTSLRSSTICKAFLRVAIPAAAGFPTPPPRSDADVGVTTSAGHASAAAAAISSARAAGGVIAGVMKTPFPSFPIFAASAIGIDAAPAAA